jgi:RNA polymerase sigma factor (sigma-70 family)
MLHPPPTNEEALEWQKIAVRIAKNQTQKLHDSLGYEALAADAIEKLLAQKIRPENIPGWFKTVITNSLIDRNRKYDKRPRRLSDPIEEVNELVHEYFDGLPRSLGTPLVQKDEVRRILEELSDRDRQTIGLIANGWSTQEVADELGYASAKVVANRLKIIRKKMIEAFGEDGKYFLQNL